MQRRGFARLTDPVFLRLSAAALLFANIFAGCTYHGTQQDNPVQRRFTWYSYLNGDDIREDCEADARPRYRFVYNGVYVQQVRSYDIRPVAGECRQHPQGPRDRAGRSIRGPNSPAVFDCD